MFNKMCRILKNRKGFTLVELMVVVVIIGVLSAIAVPIYKNVTTNAEKNACLANLRIVDGAYQTYKADSSYVAPETDDWSGLKAKVVPGWIQEEPKCPGKGTYSWTAAGGARCSVHKPSAAATE